MKPSRERVQRAQDAFQKYRKNISRTPKFRMDNMVMQQAFFKGDRAEYQRRDNALMNNQYSRRTYMGLNEG